VTQTIIKETGEVIKTTGHGETSAESTSGINRILHLATFGNDRVLMTPVDVAKIKHVANPGTDTSSLIILGFKPQDAIQIDLTVDKAYFIYPTDEGADGSICAFANLHAAMIRKEVIAIGELLTRISASSRLVAIFPQAEQKEIYDDGYEEQITPPGMIVVTLPFEDDVRMMEHSLACAATDALVEEAVDLIRHQKLEGIELGINFENAAIEKFWRYIEAVALETTIPAKEQHETELNDDEVLKVAGAQIEAFRDSLPSDVEIEKPKRKKESNGRIRHRLVAALLLGFHFRVQGR
jgi:ATP-dependent DNA helicase 2 subunit 1